MTPDHSDHDGTDDERDAGWKRREMMKATAAGAATASIAGCSQLTTKQFSAKPVALKNEAGTRGYTFEDAKASKRTKERTVKGTTFKVTVTSQGAAYDHGGSGFVDSFSVGLVATPTATVRGESFNPLTGKSLSELLQADAGKRFLKELDIESASWSKQPTEVASTTGTLLGTGTTVKTFAGVTGGGDLALVNAAKVDHQGDLVLVGDARTRAAESGDPAGQVDQSTVDAASNMFLELLPLVVRQKPGKLSGTPTDEPTDEAEAHAYDVVQSGLTADEFDDLRSAMAEEFDANPELFEFDGGVARYLDEDNYLRVPTGEVAVEEVDLPEPEEGTARDNYTTVDVGAVQELPEPPNPDTIESAFRSALDEAGLDPGSRFEGMAADNAKTTYSTRHTMIDLFGEDGSKVSSRALDTVIDVGTALEGAEIVGSGSKIHASFARVDGEVVLTHLRYAHPKLGDGVGVGLVDVDQVAPAEAYADELPDEATEPELSGRQVYRAPLPGREIDNPLGEGSFEPQRIVPFYQYQGTASSSGEYADLELIGTHVPAVGDESLVPQPELDVSVDGSTVNAEVTVDGGQPPYMVEWGSEDMATVPSLDHGEPANVSFELAPRESIDETTVKVEVGDANGVTASASETVSVDVGGTSGLDASTAVGASSGGTAALDSAGVPGVADFGFESANWNISNGNGKGFVRQMNNSFNEKFTYWGEWCWERDYRDPNDANPPDYDSTYGDNADFQYYVGHGNPQLFSFKDSDHERGYFPYWNGNGDWGDYDAEWIALYSCSVLRPLTDKSHPRGKCNGCGGKTVTERWGDNFDGLHLLLGFQDLAITFICCPNFSNKFGKRLQRGMKVWKAWIWAIHNHEPNTDPRDGFIGRGRVISPIGPGNCSPVDDHIWGKGNVGPDIPENKIQGWWTIRGG